MRVVESKKMLSSGFSNATVSKFLVIYFVASSIGLAVFDAKHLAHIQVNPHLWRYGQISRVLLWQAAGYANSTETLFAAILTYQLRVVERMWGSRKFAVSSLSREPLPFLFPCIGEKMMMMMNKADDKSRYDYDLSSFRPLSSLPSSIPPSLHRSSSLS